MSELDVHVLIESGTVTVLDVLCPGTCRHRSEEEVPGTTHVAFPYRGVYVVHAGDDQVVADANHVLFFNRGEPYQVSHPVPGGDATLVLDLPESMLHELTPAHLVRSHDPLGFNRWHLRIDARAQALVALLRHSLHSGTIERLEAESLSLTLLCRSLGPRTTHTPGATHAQRRLVDRVKVMLAGDLARRWTLAEIATEIGGSAVYLTQVFKQVEGMPLYRYHLRLRLARALDLITQQHDLSALAHDLGFSSHSHFAAAFKQAYGRSPTEFKQVTG